MKPIPPEATGHWIALVVLALASAGCPERDDGPPPPVLEVAAASDLRYAMVELTTGFGRTHPDVTVRTSYGSSGQFESQIRNGAPFDLYFSADIAYPERLAERDLASRDGVFSYAIGRIVLWVQRDSPVDVQSLGIDALTHESVRRVAVANPRHAPYGRAAMAALSHYRLRRRLAGSLVLGDNVSQAAQFVQSGNADIGIIANSLAVAPPMREAGSHWEIPADAYPEMRQGGMILRRSPHQEAARAFRDHVLGPEGREVLSRFGFGLPDP